MVKKTKDIQHLWLHKILSDANHLLIHNSLEIMASSLKYKD